MKSAGPGKFQIIELVSIGLTVFLKFILMDWLGMRAFYIAGACLFWFGYVVYRYSLDHSTLRLWGLKKENFRKSLRVLLPFLTVSAVITIIYGKLNHILIINLHILPVLLLYPIWGVIQQFMLMCIFARNLQNTIFFSSRKYLVIILVSFVFSLVHYPYVMLMGFTFIMEVVFFMVYLRWRNLWAIGFTHGWIASFLMYYALNRDLWIELFAWF
jgi:hypothetical protein